MHQIIVCPLSNFTNFQPVQNIPCMHGYMHGCICFILATWSTNSTKNKYKWNGHSIWNDYCVIIMVTATIATPNRVTLSLQFYSTWGQSWKADICTINIIGSLTWVIWVALQVASGHMKINTMLARNHQILHTPALLHTVMTVGIALISNHSILGVA